MKLLFVSTHPLQGTGYARVANKISNYLANIPGVEVVYYALQNFTTIEGRTIDPKIKIYDAQKMDSKTLFSYDGFVPVLEKEKPDALFIYYEPALAINYMDMIPPHLKPKYLYLYLDIVYRWQKQSLYTDLKRINPTHIFTFLDYWKRHLVDELGFDKDKVTTLPHGIDFDKFFRIPAEEAKLKLGFKIDDYIILNMNRNSFRKMLDRTIRPFLQFLKEEKFNPRIKLLFGCEPHRKGDINNNLVDLIVVECFNAKINPDVILKNHIFFMSGAGNRSDEQMNLIYNASDVGINTSGGEGFGLTLAEHGYLGKTIITSQNPAALEVLGGFAYYINVSTVMTAPGSECNIGHVLLSDEDHITELMKGHFEFPGFFEQLPGYLIKKFSWENAYKVLDQFFRNGALQASEQPLLSNGCK
jgi:glycosyltransferase involved in cell wall biosynthesis